MRSLLSLSLVFLAAILSGVVSAVAIDERSDCVTEICLDPFTSALAKRQAVSAAPLYRKDLTNVERLARGLPLKRRTTPAPVKRQATSTSPINRRDLTNAQRLARGLPLKPPTRRTPTIAARDPGTSALPTVTYTVVIQVFSGSTSLGYVAPDPNYWTPLLDPSIDDALQLSFTLPAGATSGSQIDLTMLNDNRGTFFGPVVGRDSTSSDIAPGSFNYLYLDPTAAPGSAPGSVPVSIPSYFSTSSGLDVQAETSVWSVDLVTMTLTAQWINSDGTSPATVLFVQSNHLYGGGDPDAFHSRYPAPVTAVTLGITLVS